MAFAHRSAIFAQKALSFQVLLANRAVETLAMVIVVHGLDPAVTGLDREAARVAFGSKQLIPISFAIRQAVLEIKVAVAEKSAAIGTGEAFGVELLADSIQTIAFNAFRTAGAVGSQVVLETAFAVELLLLLDKADVVKGSPAVLHGADEVIGTPRQTQGRHKLASNLGIARGADGNTSTDSDLLIKDTFTTSWC